MFHVKQILVWLLISGTWATAARADEPAPEIQTPTAPQLPSWPTGLSEPREGPGGTLLPPDLAEATVRRMLACRALPARCQAQLDGMALECGALVRGAIRDSAADCRAGRILDAAATAKHWTTLDKILAVGAGVLAGVGTGALLVIVAQRSTP